MKRLLCLLLALVCLSSAALAELSHEIPAMTDALIQTLNNAYSLEQYLNGDAEELPDPVLYNVNFTSGGTPFFFTDEDTFWVVPFCGPSYGLDGKLTESALHNVLFVLYVEDSWDYQAKFIGYTLALRGGVDAYETGMAALNGIREEVSQVNAENGSLYKVFEINDDTKLKVVVSGSEAVSGYSFVEILLDFPTPWVYDSDVSGLIPIL